MGQRDLKQNKSQLIEEQFQHVLFIINGCPHGNEYQKATVQFIGLLKDFLISQRTKNTSEENSNTNSSERSSRDKDLFLGLQTAIDLNPHKINVPISQCELPCHLVNYQKCSQFIELEGGGQHRGKFKSTSRLKSFVLLSYL